MAEGQLINGTFGRSKGGYLNMRLQLYGEDADQFDRFCAENNFDFASQALRALVLGGIAEWPKWGVFGAERKVALHEFKREMMGRWLRALDQMIKDLKLEVALMEQEAPNAHQT